MSYLYNLWDDFISLLFPRLCYGCGGTLLRNEKLICIECYILIPRTKYHLQEDNPIARLFWGRCKIERAAAFSFYSKDSRIRKLIHNLREVGFELGKIYGQSLLDSDFLKGIDMIIPVPLHPSKKRIRGFNQSEIIAGGFSEATGLPVFQQILERTTRSQTQTKRSRYDRWINVEGIFNVSTRDAIEGKHILIIDDVITTGSTLEACAVELLKSERVKVSVAALAVAVV
jgi:competence protein ComFC